MKCNTTNTVLTFLLGALLLLDVVFALRTIIYSRELRSLQIQAMQDQAFLNQFGQLESIAKDTIAYNQKNPTAELTRILQAAQTQTKPAATAK